MTGVALHLAKNHKSKKLIAPTEIVKRYKISYQTLNYYTNLGLFSAVNKVGNKRYYDELVFKHNLEKIQQLKNEGYTLGLIRKLLTN
jgi:DNA-binding transcriptional MerR regulator